MGSVITPVEITDTKLLYSNIPEPDTANGEPAIYAVGTTYAEGAKCTVVATHMIYESLKDGNVGKYPPTDILVDDPSWAEYGYTNKWQLFDKYANTQSVQAELVDYIVDATRTSAVALFNVSASEVVLTAMDASNVVLKTETIQMIEDNCTDWFDYFFMDFEYRDRLLWEYPIGFGTKLRVQAKAPSSTAKVGILRHGCVRYIGMVAQEVSAGIVDFSIKEEDSYGRVFLKQGAYHDVLDVMLYINNEATSNISRFLKSLRAAPAVYVLDNEENITANMEPLIVYGFFKDFGVVVKTKHPGSVDECSLTVEGLM